jgi:alginate O-acetyltransferase complex protein AlgJ
MTPRASSSPLTREAVAHVEVGQTAVAPATARLITGGFLAVLALLPFTEWLGGRLASPAAGNVGAWARLADLPAEMRTRVDALAPPASTWDRVVAANRAVLSGLTTFEAALEDRSPVGTLLRPPTQVLLSGTLGAGNEQVYVGRGGWLYFRPDVEYVTGRGLLEPEVLARRVARAGEFVAPPAPDPRPAILRFARDLDARGITLVLMPTPVKPTVHPERLASRFVTAPAPAQNASYWALIEGLRAQGVRVFDPAPLLAAHHADTGEAQYLATDTHWRPEAMQRVARALADSLRQTGTLPAVPVPGYRTAARQARSRGDTLVALDLPAWQALYAPETVALTFVMDAAGDPWRPEPGADVLLLGDSFTNIFSLASMGWGEAAGFAEHLSLALQRPLDRIVENDAGARATRDRLVRELVAARRAGGPARFTGTRVVVWQFATRELASGDWAVLPLSP